MGRDETVKGIRAVIGKSGLRGENYGYRRMIQEDEVGGGTLSITPLNPHFAAGFVLLGWSAGAVHG